MSESATILVGAEGALCTNPLMGVLKFFGIEPQIATPLQFLTDDLTGEPHLIKTRVLCSCRTLCEVLNRLDQFPKHAELWRRNVHSVFVYADEDSNAFRELKERIVDHGYTPVIQFDHRHNQWIISDKCPDFCGAMGGLRITAKQRFGQVAEDALETDAHTTAFSKGVYETVPIFLLASTTVVDIDAPLNERNFDIREHLLSAAPIVMFVKWAFGRMAWHTEDTNACLVIDDPLLRPTYGFVNYRSLLALMERYNFTTNVAFIPWNWRRCDRSVVDLFRSHSERYSVSIHGCDHTGGEFGIKNMGRLAWKSHQAVDRMMRMEAEVGLPHDRIMVFPQGVFSGPSMAALKQARYLAAVNTEVMNHDVPQFPITISDVWDIAVMRYECFPLFTRRYPAQGIENFAFDILLGKPCIVVSHHDICRDDQAQLIAIVQQLNALNCRLAWRGLGEVVRRSCRKRELSAGRVEVEMYGSELQLNNTFGQHTEFRITRRETDKTVIREVHVDGHPIPWEFADEHVRFATELGAGQSASIRIVVSEYGVEATHQDNMAYRLKVMVRRYLSEMRDNYVAVWTA
ncbi:MAG TPA: hypothetical protein PKD12_00350 [Nitrospira sp.]|nr:hypothetical protein [Nitrospira sp.]